MLFTFYSFKGGVGRSMALANVGELLRQKGLDVLLVDFDLEAPGLDRFFDLGDDLLERRGVIDLVLSYKALRALPRPGGSASVAGAAEVQPAPPPAPFPVEPLASFITKVSADDKPGGRLYLMTAGQRSAGKYDAFAEKVRKLDWDDFYLNCEGERFFDWLRDEAGRTADVVLIDSRTGISEMSGICTYQLAHAVVMLVAPNTQNLHGTCAVATHLRNQEKEKPILMVPSRIDGSESSSLADFKSKFLAATKPFAGYAGLEFVNDQFDDLKIPYVARYAYNEKMAALEPDQPVAADLMGAYNRLVAAMVALADRRSRFYARYYARTKPAAALSPGARAPADVPSFTDRRWVFEAIDEWLAGGSPQIFLLTGGPGSGKTTLAARLVEISDGDAESSFEHIVPGTVAYGHFCGDDAASSDPRAFVESLATALARRYPAIATALVAADGRGIRVVARRNIDVGATGGQGGLVIDSIDSSSVSVTEASVRLLQEPIASLFEHGQRRPIVVLIDALDEAIRRGPDAPSLFHIVSSARVLPPRMLRIIITSRRVPTILGPLRDAKTVDLVLDEPAAAKTDIHSYIRKRLAEGRTSTEGVQALVDRVAEVSEGNFLLARVILDALGSKDISVDRLTSASAASSMETFYRHALWREIGSDSRRWSERDALLLGTLAVAQGEGLSVEQLAGILGRSLQEANDDLRPWMEYLVPADSGGLQPFHPSFRDFLLANKEYPVPVAAAHGAIATYFLKEYSDDWAACEDLYAFRYTAKHLVGAMDATLARQAKLTIKAKLDELLTSGSFIDSKTRRCGWRAVVEDLVGAPPSPAVLGNLGLVLFRGGEAAKAAAAYEQAIALARQEGDARTASVLFGNLGRLYRQMGEPDKAIEYLGEAAGIAETMGDVSALGSHLGNTGLVLFDRGQVDRAMEYFARAAKAASQVGDRREEAAWLGALGNGSRALGNLDGALGYHQRALGSARLAGDAYGEAIWAQELAADQLQAGDTVTAIEGFRQALAAAERAGQVWLSGSIHGHLGVAYAQASQYDHAMDSFARGLAVAQQLGEDSVEANLLVTIGDVAVDRGRLADGRQAYEQAERLFAKIGDVRSRDNAARRLKRIVDGAEHLDTLVPADAGGRAVPSGDVNHASATRETLSVVERGLGREEIEPVVAPIERALQNLPRGGTRDDALEKARALKSELRKGAGIDDTAVAHLIDGLVTLVPRIGEAVVMAMGYPSIAGIIGPVTRFALERIGIQRARAATKSPTPIAEPQTPALAELEVTESER